MGFWPSLSFSGCHFFWGTPKSDIFCGVTFWTNFWTLFVTFLRHPYRGLPRCSKGIQSGYRRWSKTGHLRVPKTPILTKNGDFWTKTPRGSPELGTPQKPLFWGFLKIGQKAVIFGSKFGPLEKGPKKGSFLGVFRGVKNGHFGKLAKFDGT